MTKLAGQLHNLTLADLHELCRKIGVSGVSGLKKVELVTKIISTNAKAAKKAL